MSKRNLKRVAVSSRESQFIVEETKFRLKHQSLLEEFLELQKDTVSKKKKLRIALQKREILFDEVQFLRERHRYLMKIQFDDIQLDEDIIQQQNSPMQTEEVGEPVKVKKQLKTCLINGKKLAKKKISWEDQVDTKV